MLIAGGILYGIFLIFSGVGLIDKFLCFELFGELIVTWNAMSYLTAIKDYRGIMLSFLAAIAVTFLSGALLLFLGISHVEALMAAVCIGYGSCFYGMLFYCMSIFHKVISVHSYF